MGSAIGPVFTFLLAQLPAVVQAVNVNAVVIDGPATPPSQLLPLTPYVSVGGKDPWADQDAAAGARQYVTIGPQRIDEDFTIPIYIYAANAGTDQAGPRNTVLATYDAVCTFIAGNVTMGGALLQGRRAEIAATALEQTPQPDANTGEQIGYRWACISLQLSCANAYTP